MGGIGGWGMGGMMGRSDWIGGCIVLGYGSKSCGLSGGALRPSCCCGTLHALSMFVLPLGPRWVVGFGRAGPRSASPSAASSSAGDWGACGWCICGGCGRIGPPSLVSGIVSPGYCGFFLFGFADGFLEDFKGVLVV